MPETTYQDVPDAPPHMVAEIVDDVLYAFPKPAPAHAVAGSRIGIRIGIPFDIGGDGPVDTGRTRDSL